MLKKYLMILSLLIMYTYASDDWLEKKMIQGCQAIVDEHPMVWPEKHVCTEFTHPFSVCKEYERLRYMHLIRACMEKKKLEYQK